MGLGEKKPISIALYLDKVWGNWKLLIAARRIHSLLCTPSSVHRRWTPNRSKLSGTRMEATQAGLHTCRCDMNYTWQTNRQGPSMATPPRSACIPHQLCAFRESESDRCVETVSTAAQRDSTSSKDWALREPLNRGKNRLPPTLHTRKGEQGLGRWERQHFQLEK